MKNSFALLFIVASILIPIIIFLTNSAPEEELTQDQPISNSSCFGGNCF